MCKNNNMSVSPDRNITLRLPRKLLALLKLKASGEGILMNSYVERALQEKLTGQSETERADALEQLLSLSRKGLYSMERRPTREEAYTRSRDD